MELNGDFGLYLAANPQSTGPLPFPNAQPSSPTPGLQQLLWPASKGATVRSDGLRGAGYFMTISIPT